MKIKTIDVQAKEWFDKVNGNSYFSEVITINYGMANEKTIDVPMQYGYGDQYIHTAFMELQKHGYIKQDNDRGSYWQYYRDNKIIVRHSKHDNCLKRELTQ